MNRFPGGILGAALLILFGNGTAQRDRLPLIPDGGWHRLEVPLYEFTTRPIDWSFDRAKYLTLCFYLTPQETCRPLAFTLRVDSLTLIDGYNPMLQSGLVMEGSAAGKTSRGAKLTYALLGWLAEPSLKLDQFGGYVPPSASTAQDKSSGPRPVDWTVAREIRLMYRHAYLGLVGAMSDLSRGESSPEDLIRAAKAAGLRGGAEDRPGRKYPLLSAA